MDHKAEAFRKLLSQYKNSPNLIGFLDAFLTISQDVEDRAQTLFKEFDLNTATGVYLDAIGELVGLPRFSLPLNPIGFEYDVTHFDEGIPFADTPYINFRLINDDEFRRALRAWSITINSLGSTDDLILSLTKLWEIFLNEITITETGYDTININVSVPLRFDDVSLYNYVTPSTSLLWPKVAGVMYNLTYPPFP